VSIVIIRPNPFLLYHETARAGEGNDICLSGFHQQMRYLSDHDFQCMHFAGAVRRVEQGQRLPDKSFVLTFDDGCRDFYTHAAPILEEFGFTAIVFLVAGQLGSNSEWRGRSGADAVPLMTVGQIRELAGRGFAFGSHTLTHPRLPDVDQQHAEREIRESKQVLEDCLGAPIEFLSYPYGASDDGIREIVADSGYAAACGTDRNPSGRFNIWRQGCEGDEPTKRFSTRFRRRFYSYTWLREETLAGQAAQQLKKMWLTLFR
jgi:peptidoglycan/xylan/chitin deacetylase (PgdA/CDA1 family)